MYSVSTQLLSLRSTHVFPVDIVWGLGLQRADMTQYAYRQKDIDVLLQESCGVSLLLCWWTPAYGNTHSTLSTRTLGPKSPQSKSLRSRREEAAYIGSGPSMGTAYTVRHCSRI